MYIYTHIYIYIYICVCVCVLFFCFIIIICLFLLNCQRFFHLACGQVLYNIMNVTVFICISLYSLTCGQDNLVFRSNFYGVIVLVLCSRLLSVNPSNQCLFLVVKWTKVVRLSGGVIFGSAHLYKGRAWIG